MIVTALSKNDEEWSTELSHRGGYSGSRDNWIKETGMQPSEYTTEMGVEFNQWYLDSAKEERLRSFINRFKYLNDTGVLEYADIYFKAGIAGKLLGFTGSTGILSNIGNDAALQFVITGDVDIISAGASGVTGRYRHIARIVGANFDYSINNGYTATIFSQEAKSFKHMSLDWGASYVPSVGNHMTSPRNYLGPNGVKFTGNAFGLLGSELLKNQ